MLNGEEGKETCNDEPVLSAFPQPSNQTRVLRKRLRVSSLPSSSSVFWCSASSSYSFSPSADSVEKKDFSGAADEDSEKKRKNHIRPSTEPHSLNEKRTELVNGFRRSIGADEVDGSASASSSSLHQLSSTPHSALNEAVPEKDEEAWKSLRRVNNLQQAFLCDAFVPFEKEQEEEDETGDEQEEEDAQIRLEEAVQRLFLATEQRDAAQEEQMTWHAARMDEWLAWVGQQEVKREKSGKEARWREQFEKTFVEVKKAREDVEKAGRVEQRTAARCNSLDGDIPSEINTVATEEEDRRKRYAAAIPPCSTRSSVQVPSPEAGIDFDSESSIINEPLDHHIQVLEEFKKTWTEQERDIFVDRLIAHGKNFAAVKLYLPNKSVTDCVFYYYMTKKLYMYKQNMKKTRRKNNQKTVPTYKPPVLPRQEEVDAFLEKVAKGEFTPSTAASHAINGAPSVSSVASTGGVPEECCVCKQKLDPANLRPLTRAVADVHAPSLGETDKTPQVCTRCALDARGGHLCPLRSCPKRKKAKATRQFPPKWEHLEEHNEAFLRSHLGMPPGTYKVCPACRTRMQRAIEQLIDGTLSRPEEFSTGATKNEEWTEERVERLVHAVENLGYDWAAVAQKIGNATARSCQQRYLSYMKKTREEKEEAQTVKVESQAGPSSERTHGELESEEDEHSEEENGNLEDELVIDEDASTRDEPEAMEDLKPLAIKDEPKTEPPEEKMDTSGPPSTVADQQAQTVRLSSESDQQASASASASAIGSITQGTPMQRPPSVQQTLGSAIPAATAQSATTQAIPGLQQQLLPLLANQNINPVMFNQLTPQEQQMIISLLLQQQQVAAAQQQQVQQQQQQQQVQQPQTDEQILEGILKTLQANGVSQQQLPAMLPLIQQLLVQQRQSQQAQVQQNAAVLQQQQLQQMYSALLTQQVVAAAAVQQQQQQAHKAALLQLAQRLGPGAQIAPEILAALQGVQQQQQQQQQVAAVAQQQQQQIRSQSNDLNSLLEEWEYEIAEHQRVLEQFKREHQLVLSKVQELENVRQQLQFFNRVDEKTNNELQQFMLKKAALQDQIQRYDRHISDCARKKNEATEALRLRVKSDEDAKEKERIARASQQQQDLLRRSMIGINHPSATSTPAPPQSNADLPVRKSGEQMFMNIAAPSGLPRASFGHLDKAEELHAAQSHLLQQQHNAAAVAALAEQTKRKSGLETVVLPPGRATPSKQQASLMPRRTQSPMLGANGRSSTPGIMAQQLLHPGGSLSAQRSPAISPRPGVLPTTTPRAGFLQPGILSGLPIASAVKTIKTEYESISPEESTAAPSSSALKISNVNGVSTGHRRMYSMLDFEPLVKANPALYTGGGFTEFPTKKVVPFPSHLFEGKPLPPPGLPIYERISDDEN